MSKRRGRPCKQSQKITESANLEKHQVEKEDYILSKEEVECRSAAVRAICGLEIKDILSLLGLLRSKFNDEQLHIPVRQFFRENLPNLAVVRKKDGSHEVKRKEADGNLSMDQFHGRNVHVSLLRQLSMAYPDCSNAIKSFGEFGSSSKSVKTTLFGAENMQIKQFVLEDPYDTQMFELQGTLQTPGVNSNPLSVGMTPKTLRLPKTGEVLLSVHGSPLGVYKEDNMEPIHVECRSAAVRAICGLEIKDILSLLGLLRSKFNDEQLHIPVRQFFRENLPNLAVVRKKDGSHEVKRKEADGNLSMDQFHGRNVHVSLLRQLSMAYPDCSNAIKSFGEFGSSSKSVKTTLFGAENMQIKQFVLEDPYDTQMFELQGTLQTPGVNSNPLSVGMTPKTLRLPKTGEVLLSVHGSPLGVYKEDNMEPIHESEDA